jgi:VIT1/CCC1 family predicted Fe2+/Mn2+ transporter
MKNVEALVANHSHEVIKKRLAAPQKHNYVGDAVLGGIDGCITTFAIVSSSVAAGLPNMAALVLGLANITADGFSMAISNYQAAKSRGELVETLRKEEARHIKLIPEGEREEVRQIYANKGFSGELLEEVVAVITADEERWIDTMIREEHGLQTENPNPVMCGLTTFAAFLAIGILPLLPFMLTFLPAQHVFASSTGIAALAFFGIGCAKGKLLGRPVWRNGFGTLLIGMIAAALAYAVGDLSKAVIGQF